MEISREGSCCLPRGQKVTRKRGLAAAQDPAPWGDCGRRFCPEMGPWEGTAMARNSTRRRQGTWSLVLSVLLFTQPTQTLEARKLGDGAGEVEQSRGRAGNGSTGAVAELNTDAQSNLNFR